MQTSAKDQIEETFHKLDCSFKVIFEDTDDISKRYAETGGEKNRTESYAKVTRA